MVTKLIFSYIMWEMLKYQTSISRELWLFMWTDRSKNIKRHIKETKI